MVLEFIDFQRIKLHKRILKTQKFELLHLHQSLVWSGGNIEVPQR